MALRLLIRVMTQVGRARRARSLGYSFLEVLTATTIMATVLAIGVPNFVSLRKPYKVIGAARQIAADLQFTRQRAIARNARCRVRFDTTAKTWTIEREVTPNSNSWTADASTRALPSGVSFGAISPGNPVFDTRGMLSAGVSVPVTMTGVNTRTVNANVLGKTSIS